MLELFIILLGFLFGSFASMLTSRIPKGEDIVKGRSRCDSCRKKIAWYDNIPVVSFLLLSGKCRKCSKPIGIRYPLIEIITAVIFWLVYKFSFQYHCLSGFVCVLRSELGPLFLPFALFVSFILFLIFVIDLEEMIIPDALVFILFCVSFAAFLLIDSHYLFANIFSGFFLAGIFVLLHLVTKGKGMGLGDVKLAIPIGFILGLKAGILWFFLSFLTGAIVGIILILMKKARFGKTIPFGPFMVFSFFLISFLENYLSNLLLIP